MWLSVLKKILGKKKRLSVPMMESFASLNLSMDDLILFKNIKELTKTRVKEIMTPRADIEWIDVEKTKSVIKNQLMKTDRSYLMVGHNSLDKVIGKISVKPTLVHILKDKSFAIEPHITPVLYVSPSLKVLDLILKMKKAKNFLALVVDEFGGVDGLVTFHDIILEVLDELEMKTEKILPPILYRNHTVVLDGRYPIEEFEENYGPLSSDKETHSETIAGLISNLVGRVPRKGEIIDHDSGLRFEILECNVRKIIKVKVHGLNHLKNIQKKKA